MSDQEYSPEEDDFEQCGLGNTKRMTKNQLIYGDFYEAYEEQLPSKQSIDPFQQYNHFKIGTVLENYSSEIQVDVPKSKKPPKSQLKVGNFTMESFLQTVNQGLDQIDQESERMENEDEQPSFNSKVKQSLKLIKIGEEEEEPSELDLNEYLQIQRTNFQPKKPKKTQHQKELEKQFISGYGIGYKMLEKMGYNVGMGLGKDQQGKQTPVEAQLKTSLTAKDQIKREKKPKKDESEEEQEKEEEKKKFAHPFEELFLYYSSDPKINLFLMKMKNKYEKLGQKVNTFDNQNQSFAKEVEISENIKIQKLNELNTLSHEIDGLNQIHGSDDGFKKHPHLGLSYNADILIVKNSLNRLMEMNLSQLKQNLGLELKQTKKLLQSIYLAKEKQTLKNFDLKSQFHHKEMEEVKCVQISSQDSQKISNFIKMILQHTVITKLQAYLKLKTDISQCDLIIADVIQALKPYDHKHQILKHLTSSYIIPLTNKYLTQCPLTNITLYPHHVIFPWLLIINIQSLDLQKFIYRISACEWQLCQRQLYDLILPWLQYIDSKNLHFFIHFYLSPRLLYQMQQYEIDGRNKKNHLKNLMMYGALLPKPVIQEILKNSLAGKILRTYQRQKTQQNEKDVLEWAREWGKKLDKLSPKLLQATLFEHDIDIS